MEEMAFVEGAECGGLRKLEVIAGGERIVPRRRRPGAAAQAARHIRAGISAVALGSGPILRIERVEQE